MTFWFYLMVGAYSAHDCLPAHPITQDGVVLQSASICYDVLRRPGVIRWT